MKTRILILSFLVAAQTSFCQLELQNMNLLKFEELANLSKRPLIIVEYTEAQIRSNDLQRSLSKSKGEVLERAQKYNEDLLATDKTMKDHFLSIVKENWKFNDLNAVKVLSFEDARKIAVSKSEEYCYVYLRSFGEEHNYMAMNITGEVNGSVTIPVMVLQGSEHFGSSKNYFGFPLMNSTDGRAVLKQDIEITLKIMNQYVTDALKNGEQLKTREFVGNQIVENCNLKRDLTLHVNQEFINDLGEEKIAAAWQGKASVQPQAEFISSYSSSSDDAFAILIPMAVATGSMGPLTKTSTVYGRLAVQTSTGKILGFSKSKMGQKLAEENFNEGHFTDMGECE